MAAMPEPWKSLRRAFEILSERVKKLENTSPFSGTGMSIPDPGVVQVDGSLNVTAGEVQSGDFVTGSTGWHLDSSGNAEFNDVTLRGILVGLDTPVQIDVARVGATGFSLSTSFVEKDGVTVTVPAGCTRVAATLFGRLYVVNQNTTGGADGTGTEAIYVRCVLGASTTVATPTGVSGSNGFATTVGFDSFAPITGLTPGSTLHFGVEAKCGYVSIPTFVDNYINAVATLTWLR